MKYTGIGLRFLKFFLALSLMVNFTCLPGPVTVEAATPEEIEAAVVKGVAWLAAQQQPNGSWGNYYPVAETAFVVAKLCDRAIEKGYSSPFDPTYPYATQVQAGLDYIFGQTQTYDADKIFWGSWDQNYINSIILMALGSTSTPTRVVNVAGSVVNGLTYQQVCQKAVNYLLAGQCSTGGWYYNISPSYSDQSVTGWVGLALAYAGKFGISTPQTVKDNLKNWNTAIQGADGGAGYTSPGYSNVYRTGHLLFNQAMVGDIKTTPAVVNAINYIQNMWYNNDYDGWRYYNNYGNFMATYTLMKGLVALGITTLNVTGHPTLDWFDDMSTFIINCQLPDGSWANPDSLWGYMPIMNTALALLTLEKAVAKPQVSVYVDIKPGLCPNNIRMGEKTRLYVAICGTADLNVRDIDPKSIKIGRDGMEATVAGSFYGYRDMATPYTGTGECWNKRADKRIDLIITFPTQTVINTLLLREEPKNVPLPLQITGKLLDAKGGTPVVGQDNVRPMN